MLRLLQEGIRLLQGLRSGFWEKLQGLVAEFDLAAVVLDLQLLFSLAEALEPLLLGPDVTPSRPILTQTGLHWDRLARKLMQLGVAPLSEIGHESFEKSSSLLGNLEDCLKQVHFRK